MLRDRSGTGRPRQRRTQIGDQRIEPGRDRRRPRRFGCPRTREPGDSFECLLKPRCGRGRIILFRQARLRPLREGLSFNQRQA